MIRGRVKRKERRGTAGFERGVETRRVGAVCCVFGDDGAQLVVFLCWAGCVFDCYCGIAWVGGLEDVWTR
jgi:hypothetical protein